LAGAGEIAQGLATIDEALARSEQNEELWSLAELLRIKGELVLAANATTDARAAEEYFQRSLDCARQHGARSWELRAVTSLARLGRGQGRARAAREVLAPVYRRFTEGFSPPDLVTANALLQALRSGTTST